MQGCNNRKSVSKSLIGDLTIHKKLLSRSKTIFEKNKKIPKVLLICIVEAHLTRDTELFGEMDPYVVMKYGGNIMKTEVH
jgi:hypothetical protein